MRDRPGLWDATPRGCGLHYFGRADWLLLGFPHQECSLENRDVRRRLATRHTDDRLGEDLIRPLLEQAVDSQFADQCLASLAREIDGIAALVVLHDEGDVEAAGSAQRAQERARLGDEQRIGYAVTQQQGVFALIHFVAQRAESDRPVVPDPRVFDANRQLRRFVTARTQHGLRVPGQLRRQREVATTVFGNLDWMKSQLDFDPAAGQQRGRRLGFGRERIFGQGLRRQRVDKRTQNAPASF